mmetsp:Transcript_72449/g.183380  ORF Transcript_72449/g.183380 Transcript_72449/m.183380 type:complete len:338 (+) Transcript_72449:67-1080(+)
MSADAAVDAAADGMKFLLGLSCALANGVMSSIGFTMQRKAQLISEESRDEDVQRRSSFIRNAGVVLYILAAVPDVISYTLVPQVVCTTVACFRLVFVTFLAHTFLHEEVRGREALGMAICTLGTFLCLVFGPRPEDIKADDMAQTFYHAQVWTYLGFGLVILVLLLAVEHLGRFGTYHSSKQVHYITLPLATGLAFALEKVFNTEIGFVQTPASLPGLFDTPLWCTMVVSIVLLGLTDFYLNLRGAASMPVQVFLPTAFALSTSLQFFQSIFIFGEFADMTARNAALSIWGALISLGGTLLIQPPRFDLLTGGHSAFEDEDLLEDPNSNDGESSQVD